jgi:CrcB protein
MTPLLVLGIGVVGGVGAIARFTLDSAVSDAAGRDFPYGTLLVNLTGAFALGLIMGAAVGINDYRLEGTGFIGAFTTFSTWAFESHRLGEDGQLRAGVLNLLVSLVLGVAAAWAGRALGGAL